MLPRLRTDLDFQRSPFPDRPGLVIRDPFRYSDAMLIVPPALVACLEQFDGSHSELDLREYLVRLTGDIQVSDLEKHLVEALSEAGFLDNQHFLERKDEAEKTFAAAPFREAAQAGTGYPAEKAALQNTLRQYLDGPAPPPDGRVLAIAAPHVSPFGGADSYRAAYAALTPADAARTFVVLGTSHYGAPDRIGLTRKPFVTPLGESATDAALVDELARGAGEGAALEDYCHSFEHSIEFQVVFLQHLFGSAIRIVPVLCGPFVRSLYRGGMPEDDDRVRRIIGAVGDLAAREGDRLLWVLGVDMAHMGERYGDQQRAASGTEPMQEVARRDRGRIERMEAGDARGFWELIQQNRDDLKWCGSAPIYTFLKAVPTARGRLLHYQQWNIDQASVVSFAGLKFH